MGERFQNNSNSNKNNNNSNNKNSNSNSNDSKNNKNNSNSNNSSNNNSRAPILEALKRAEAEATGRKPRCRASLPTGSAWSAGRVELRGPTGKTEQQQQKQQQQPVQQVEGPEGEHYRSRTSSRREVSELRQSPLPTTWLSVAALGFGGSSAASWSHSSRSNKNQNKNNKQQKQKQQQKHPSCRVFFFPLLLILGAGAQEPSARRCAAAVPRLWRHFGCERWDCGDLGEEGSFAGCQGAASSSKCSAPAWSCDSPEGDSASSGAGSHLRPEGSFLCLDGQWADLLPFCLGDTSPGAAGGTWRAQTREVRAVLFKLKISWTEPAYKPTLCTRTTWGALVQASCRPVDFGVLLQQNLWRLLFQALQAALCDPALNLGLACNGTLSRHGDRLRGAAQRRPEVAGCSAGPGRWFRGARPRPLRTSRGGKHRPPGSWFPSVRFSFSGEPYIINHRSVPDWELEVVPAPAVDSRLGLLSSLAEMERLALEVSCGLLGASWLGLFLMRCLGWRVLFGKKGSPWQLAQTSRGLSLIALLTDFVELLLASLVFGFSLWLSRSHFEETSQQWLSRLAAAIGLFVALLVAALPLSRLSLQLLMAEGAGMLPSSRRLCRRRLPPQKWIRLLFLVILWHGLALVAALVATGSKIRRDVF
ncbi:unnamed protein product [Polarella glacialis]|uniref:Uncharacterized protein n=1 Tax=Polarella glacialis TaxID=89957 RepID=A0A813INN4_POLGL|nr:unnamed protein product [Polarella glacialis]